MDVMIATRRNPSAVQNLQLALLILEKTDVIGFNAKDVSNIVQVIETVRERMLECSRLHDTLEVKTIEASILRHKLELFPEEICKQIQRAVKATRELNATELNRLLLLTKDNNDKILHFQALHIKLRKDLKQLLQEQKSICTLHECSVTKLNLQMEKKSSLQICFNETRNETSRTIKEITRMNDRIILCKDSLINERNKILTENIQLDLSIDENVHHFQEQKNNNVEKKCEVDILGMERMQLESQLFELRRSRLETDTALDNLEDKALATKEHMDKLLANNRIRKVEILFLNNLTATDIADFEAQRTLLRIHQKEMNDWIKSGNCDTERMDAQQDTLASELKERMRAQDEVECEVITRTEKMGIDKSTLAYLSSEMASIRAEIKGLERSMIELQQIHKAMLDMFVVDNIEARNILIKECKIRMHLEDNLQDLTNEAQELHSSSVAYISDSNKRLTNGKIYHDKLTREGGMMHNEFKDSQSVIQKINAKEEKARLHLETSGNFKMERISTIKNSAVETGRFIESKMVSLTKKDSQFHFQKICFDEHVSAFNSTKMNLVEKINMLRCLKEFMKLAENDMDNLYSRPLLLNFQKEVKKAHSKSMNNMILQVKEVVSLERNIHMITSKGNSLGVENTRLVEAIKRKDKELQLVVSRKRNVSDLCCMLLYTLKQLEGQQHVAWINEDGMQQEKIERDKSAIGHLSHILACTADRQIASSTLLCKLNDEVLMLSQYLCKDRSQMLPITIVESKRI